MLATLIQFENLGSPKYFVELLTKLGQSDVPWTESDVDGYFSNRIVDGRMIFDGCLPLAIALGLIVVERDGKLIPDSSLISRRLTEDIVRGWLLSRLLKACKTDEVFLEIVRPEHVSYDVVYRLIQIEKSAFSFKHAGFRQLLLTLDFLSPHPDTHIRKYIVNPKYKRMFDLEIIPEVKRRKIGIEKLEEMLERNQLHGREAEEYVVAFEKNRLQGHSELELVERISDYDTGAGYDIVSFDTAKSETHDRFIEVKSFDGTVSFFWSRNEVEVAKRRKAAYYLYLVDRRRTNSPDYEPLIIRDPYDQVFINEHDWPREVPKWFFKK